MSPEKGITGLTPSGSESESQPGLDGSKTSMRLVYKGDGDYDLISGAITIELSYDGSDYSVGSWLFWNVRIGETRFGGTQHVGPGSLHDWLEGQARHENGHLSDEPDPDPSSSGPLASTELEGEASINEGGVR